MFGNFVVTVLARLLKLAALVVLVIAGIVFVPDWLVNRVDRGIDIAGGYAREVISKRGPEVVQDFKKQEKETRGELQKLHQALMARIYPVIGEWIKSLAPK